ncbi:MAG: DUF2065 family protein [Hyphomonas sp.]|uniref:DUF2065 family protein n=1 Tax=Hyphomonas sp. TaxID=87 RepID=UPI0034A05A29
MSLLTVLLAGFGVWLLVEGSLCAIAPDFMRTLAFRVQSLCPRDLILAGLVVAAIGAALLTLAVRTA